MALDSTKSTIACDASAAPALGMESGWITDAQLSASSSFDAQSVGQQNARIRTEKASGAWCPKQQIRNDSTEYLQKTIFAVLLRERMEGNSHFTISTEQSAKGNVENALHVSNQIIQAWKTNQKEEGHRILTIRRFWRLWKKTAENFNANQSKIVCRLKKLVKVDLLKTYVLHAVETQGRYGNGTGREFTEFYFIDYLSDEVIQNTNSTAQQWIRFRNENGESLMNGNTDTITTVLRRLVPPIVSRVVRIVPYSPQTRTACLRLELYGCVYLNSTPTNFQWSYEEIKLSIMNLIQPHHIVAGAVFAFLVLTFACALAIVARSRRGTSKFLKSAPSKRADGTKCVDGAFYNLCNPPSSLFGVAKFTVDYSETDTIPHTVSTPTIFEKPKATVARANLVTTIGAKGLPTHLLQRIQTFLPPQPTIFVNEERMYSSDADYYAEVQQSTCSQKKKRSAIKLSNSGTLSSCCSISIADSNLVRRNSARRKSSALNAASSNEDGASLDRRTAEAPPSLFDFNFPPPPPLSQCATKYPAATEENYYAEPLSVESTRLLDAPLQPPPPPPFSRRDMPLMRASVSTNFNSREHILLANLSPAEKLNSVRTQRKPMPKPRTSATLDHIPLHYNGGNQIQSLPKRLTKTPSPESGIGFEFQNPRSHFSSQSISGSEIWSRQIQRNRLRILKIVGNGKFTTVYLASHEENDYDSGGSQDDNISKLRTFAMKTLKINLSKSSLVAARQALQAEAQILSTIDHPNFVKYLGECEDYSILTEYVEFGDLERALRNDVLKMSKKLFAHLCTQITSALAYLEARRIVHGHFSTRSCLIEALPSCVESNASAHGVRVCIAAPRGPNLHAQLRYSAPEAIVLNEWSNKTDVWSFGVSAWEILHSARLRPFEALSNAELLENAKHVLHNSNDAIFLGFSDISKSPTTWPNSSLNICAQLMDCWHAQPSRRPNFHKLNDFFVSISNPKLKP